MCFLDKLATWKPRASVTIRHPETLPAFESNGLGMFADDEIRFTLGAAVRLRTALKAAGINADLFREKLDDAIATAMFK